MKKIKFLIILPLLAGTLAHAGVPEKAEALRKAYDFHSAAQMCRRAIAAADSTQDVTPIEEELVLCENGESMMNFCCEPTVVERIRCSKSDFFLYYPLQDGGWKPVPNALDPLGDPSKAMYVPDGAATLYFSATDENGISNICRSTFRDTVWTAPALISEMMTSASDEIFPMLSPDGKTLYFASKGLYGMGGYDLYYCTWSEAEGDWGPPSNIGFPFSSPANDYLYINTEDGRYTIFASDRDCPADSVNIYVLEYDNLPLRKSIANPAELRALAALAPKAKASGSAETAEQEPQSDNLREYAAKAVHVRTLRDSLAAFNSRLDDLRACLKDETADHSSIKNEILERELTLPARQNELEAAIRDLQAIELEFLMNGVIVDPKILEGSTQTSASAEEHTISLVRKSMGAPLELAVEKPEPKFDYTLQVLPEGQFAEDNSLPEGLVYQIQIFSSSRKATVKDIKGLSPVFERNGRTTKYVYLAGLFRRYNDALANLNKVKKAGFKSAMIVAFDNDKLISVSTAKAMESQKKDLYTLRIIAPDGSLPEAVKNAIKQQCEKDILRSYEGTTAVYAVGPFDNREECESLAAAIKATGLESVSIIKEEDSQ